MVEIIDGMVIYQEGRSIPFVGSPKKEYFLCCQGCPAINSEACETCRQEIRAVNDFYRS